jgi:hypothetical protein
MVKIDPGAVFELFLRVFPGNSIEQHATARQKAGYLERALVRVAPRH